MMLPAEVFHSSGFASHSCTIDTIRRSKRLKFLSAVTKLFLILQVCFVINGFCQQNKIREIDSIVGIIKKSDYRIRMDSTIQNSSYIGLFMCTYRVAHLTDGKLHKYENKVKALRQEPSGQITMNSNSVFYFLNNCLIKVEELMDEDGKKQNADWYYADDKPIYYTLKSDKSDERAIFLFDLSKTLVAQYIK